MRALGSLFLVLAAAALRAGDSPAPPADAIAQAKKDFASIKQPAASADQGLGLRAADAKDDGAARPDGAALPAPAARKEGTGNWLVDAMEQKPGHPQASQGDGLIEGDIDLLREADTPAAGSTQATKGGEGAASKGLAATVFNPLDAFMEGWISAHDRDLLLPARRGDSLMGGEQGGARAKAFSGIDLGQRGALADGGLPYPGAQADSRTLANPYVGDLDAASLAPARPLSAPDTAGFSPLVFPDLSRGMSAPGADPRFLDPSGALLPDFTQPQDDDKYFRQMKRF
jgi:hypothetical protein